MKKSRKRATELARRKAAAVPQWNADRPNGVMVNASLLAPDASFGVPDFVERGWYKDRPFRCVDCGAEEIWTALQQKWWYETAKGGVWTLANRCRRCRRRERERKAEARRVHLEGLARKDGKPSTLKPEDAAKFDSSRSSLPGIIPPAPSGQGVRNSGERSNSPMRKKSPVKLPKKIVIPAPKRRGRPAPAEKVIPDPRKVESRELCRKKINPEEESGERN